MNECAHDWRVTHYGPSGSGAIEQACIVCGAVRLTGPMPWVQDMANLVIVTQSMQSKTSK